jgi:hypothetical protein
MSTSFAAVPLVLGRRSLTSASSVLVAGAFFACATLFLTVAAGDLDVLPDPAESRIPRRRVSTSCTRRWPHWPPSSSIIPASTLASASATLSARRQDERLSTMSLLGAKQSQITALAVAEPLMPALAGIVLGVFGYLGLALPVSYIHFMGEPIGYGNMLMPVWLILVVVVFLVLVCAGSALLGLRKVAVSPLGVRTKSLERKFPLGRRSSSRCSAVIALPIVFALTQSGGLGVGFILGLTMVGFLALGLVVVDLVGGLLIRWFAHLSAVGARPLLSVSSPPALVSDEPKRFWRRVSGLAMAAFIAAVCGSGVALSQLGIDSAEDSEMGVSEAEIHLFHDMFTGVLLVMGIAIVLIAVSAVINQVADIYDRADTFSRPLCRRSRSDAHASGAGAGRHGPGDLGLAAWPAGSGCCSCCPWPERRSCSNRSRSSRSSSPWPSASGSSAAGCS